MHSVKAAVLIVLLLVPNSTWKDWRNTSSPALRRIIQTSAIGEMMPRTAERDKITPAAELNTVLAGARMGATTDTRGLDYPVLPLNLVSALSAKRWQIDIQTPTIHMVSPQAITPTGPQFIVRSIEMPMDSPAFDITLGGWSDRVQKSLPGSALIVMSSCPSPAEYAGHERLCPIALRHTGMTPCLLTSESTRTSGLITNTDIAPTIAGVNGLPGPIYGSAVNWTPSSTEDSFARLNYMSDSAQSQEMAQMDVPYVALALAIYLVALLAIGTRFNSNSARFALSYIAGMSSICLPIFDRWTFIVPFVCVSSVFMLFSNPEQRGRPSVPFGGMLFAFIVTCDAVFNHSLLTARSLMGYSFQEGARYYGLGNEAMGVLVGALSVVTVYVSGKFRERRWLGVLIWLIAAAIFAMPSIGAKAGGVLVVGVVLAGYLITTHPIGKALPRKRIIALILGACLAGAAILLVITAHIGGDSHVAQAMGQSQRFGPSVAISLITRKLAMDFHLMFHSAWMLVLSVSLVSQVVIRKKWLKEDANFDPAKLIWRNGLVATLACLVLNDAGVVAAALCSLFPLAALASESIPQSSSTNPSLARECP